jgi:hypothetical protein
MVPVQPEENRLRSPLPRTLRFLAAHKNSKRCSDLPKKRCHELTELGSWPEQKHQGKSCGSFPPRSGGVAAPPSPTFPQGRHTAARRPRPPAPTNAACMGPEGGRSGAGSAAAGRQSVPVSTRAALTWTWPPRFTTRLADRDVVPPVPAVSRATRWARGPFRRPWWGPHSLRDERRAESATGECAKDMPGSDRRPAPKPCIGVCICPPPGTVTLHVHVHCSSKLRWCCTMAQFPMDYRVTMLRSRCWSHERFSSWHIIWLVSRFFFWWLVIDIDVFWE